MSLPPVSYHSPESFKQEVRLLFGADWYTIGLTNDFTAASGYRSYESPIGSVIITKSDDRVTPSTSGEKRAPPSVWHAFLNSCRHRGNQLVDIEDLASCGQKLVCPYHGWTYGLDGTLLHAPKCEARIKTDRNHDLVPLEVHVVGNLLRVRVGRKHVKSFSSNPRPQYAAFEHYPLHTCRVVHEQRYTVNANWKLLVSNFCCYYHVPVIHPLLATVSKIKDHHHYPVHHDCIHFDTSPLRNNEGYPAAALSTDRMIPMNDRIQRDAAHFFVFFPNVFLFALADHAFIVIVRPVSPQQTEERTILLVHGTTDAVREQQLVDMYQSTNLEDLRVCETVQTGTRSMLHAPFKPAFYVLPCEQGVQEFDTLWQRRMARETCSL